MTDAQAFVSARANLDAHATGEEKFAIMHAKGRAKAKLLRDLFIRYSIGWQESWFPDLPPPKPSKKRGT